MSIASSIKESDKVRQLPVKVRGKYFNQIFDPKKRVEFSPLDKIKMKFVKFFAKTHSHERENARRHRQIERGIIKVTASESAS